MSRTVPPSEFELQILGVLWRQGPATVRQVLAALPDRKKRAYTSVLSVLQVMERKGLVDHKTSGQAHVYRARLSEEKALKPLLQKLVAHVFGGRPAGAVLQLLRQGDVGPEDLTEIRQLVDDMGRQKGDQA